MDVHAIPALQDDDAFRVVVESPRGSTVKLRLDPEHGVMTVGRPLPLGLVYPFDWGFVPGTCAPDGDPLDAVVLWESSTFPGVVIGCRPLGVLRVEQNSKHGSGRERNDRIVGVPLSAIRERDLRAPDDLPDRTRQELEKFFLDVTAFEGKNARILGWAGPTDAIELIRASLAQRSPVGSRE